MKGFCGTRVPLQKQWTDGVAQRTQNTRHYNDNKKKNHCKNSPHRSKVSSKYKHRIPHMYDCISILALLVWQKKKRTRKFKVFFCNKWHALKCSNATAFGWFWEVQYKTQLKRTPGCKTIANFNYHSKFTTARFGHIQLAGDSAGTCTHTHNAWKLSVDTCSSRISNATATHLAGSV